MEPRPPISPHNGLMLVCWHLRWLLQGLGLRAQVLFSRVFSHQPGQTAKLHETECGIWESQHAIPCFFKKALPGFPGLTILTLGSASLHLGTDGKRELLKFMAPLL